MKEQKLQKIPFLPTLILSWFFTGKSPKMPGTVGSLATLPLIFFLGYINISLTGILILILLLYLLAVLLTHKIQKDFDLHDPQWIVIDEVIGMLITWSFTLSLKPWHLFLTFLLFRIFDIIKIWPASFFDRLHHGFGTITDDVISAIYAGILLRVLLGLSQA